MVYKTIDDVAEKLATSFQDTASNSNYSNQFIQHKNIEESNPINFQSDNHEAYNKLFNIEELIYTIGKLKNNSPGPDEISNMLLKQIPAEGIEYILRVVNLVWDKTYFDDKWRHAWVVPIPKPQKNVSNPKNHRPISLTSCVAKVIESIINKRLVEFMEINRLFSPTQCGFRKNRSTIEHLVRLDAYVRKSLANNQRVVSIFFDMEKAFDKTWRYGILKDMYDLGLRGRLPMYISRFLENRTFQVRLRNHLSSTKQQETGIPQGSTISVTLFALKINAIYKALPRDLHTSMFVDDLQIAFSHHNPEILATRLQSAINKVAEWSSKNGFTLSESKTVSLEFFRGTKPIRPIISTLNSREIPRVESTKFLGLLWDAKLTWRPHISYLKDKCSKSMNLLRTVCTNKWGTDTEVGLRLYRAVKVENRLRKYSIRKCKQSRP